MPSLKGQPRLIAAMSVAALVGPTAAVAGWRYASTPTSPRVTVASAALSDVPIEGLTPSEASALRSVIGLLGLSQVSHVRTASPPGPTDVVGSGPGSAS